MDPLASQNFDTGMRGSPLTSRRAQSSLSGRFSRSWHPSPFASDDEDALDEAQYFKHEKRNDIKMEIARRRQQVEETGCLQDELSRMRENSEMADRLYTGSSTVGTHPGILTRSQPTIISGTNQPSGTNILKSVNDILHVDHMGGVDLGAYSQKNDLYPTTTSSSSMRLYDTSYPSNNVAMTNYSGQGYSSATDAYTGSTYDTSMNHTGNRAMGDMMNSRPHYDMNSYTNAVGGG